MKARRALVSVADSSGLEEFVAGLIELGVEIVAADATYEVLNRAGIKVRSVEQHIGADMLVGAATVPTMHPQLARALQWSADSGDETVAAAGAGVGEFDIVVMNLTPFERVSGSRDNREHDIVAAIDVDGPAILRAAARNFERVLVVADPAMYPLVLEELRVSDGDPSYDVRKLLASSAFNTTAHYEVAVANWFSEIEDFPTYLARDYVKLRDLPYGENPHQRAAYYAEVGARRHLLSMVEQLQGDDPTFTNLADLNIARQVTADFTIPACTIIKHASPAGVAVDGDIAGAFRRALACDGMSAYGGIVAVNRSVDQETALALCDHHFELLFAPAYSDGALAIIAERRPDLRVLLDSERRKKSPGERDIRRVIGGILLQDKDSEHEDRELMDVPTVAQPSEAQWGDLLFAWRVAKWVPSNAIVLAQGLTTVGIGGGKPSRYDSIRHALRKADANARGAMMASDAFFSYTDAPQAAIDSGIAGIIQPGGADNDDEIIELCDAAGIPMVFTHRRHFKH